MTRSSNEDSLELFSQVRMFGLILPVGAIAEEVLTRCSTTSDSSRDGVAGIEHSRLKPGVDVSSENLVKLPYPEEVFKDRVACSSEGFVERLFTSGLFLGISVFFEFDTELICQNLL